MIRLFDIFFSFLGLVLFFPLMLIVYVLIVIDSPGNGFFKQNRIGIGGSTFVLYKFRTMKLNADKKGLITVGERDNRLTYMGRFIRKYKIDELPQLINVFWGQMSLVGPRPEVKKYVDLYNNEQKRVLSVRPGITDHASIEFSNENEILGGVSDPEKYYIEVLLPKKIELNMKFINNQNTIEYFRIIFLTIRKLYS